MAYSTPQYDYDKASSDLMLGKTQEDATQAFGRFLGQQRHRRALTDNAQSFQRGFPKVGAAANQRGVWNSGIRRGYQRDAAQDYATATNRQNTDFAAQEGQFDLQQTLRDAAFKQRMLLLYEELQRQRVVVPPYTPPA